jgi:uncharacterized protein YdhG (YjbR/CyaY superfamily)
MKKASGMGDIAPPRNVDEYIERVPEPGRTTLNKLRATIRSVVPKETTESMSYGMPAFKYKGALVCYGAFSDHCSFFPMSARLIEEFKDELQGFSTAKGTIRFPLDKPLSAAVVKKFVKARIAQNESKHELKKRR